MADKYIMSSSEPVIDLTNVLSRGRSCAVSGGKPWLSSYVMSFGNEPTFESEIESASSAFSIQGRYDGAWWVVRCFGQTVECFTDALGLSPLWTDGRWVSPSFVALVKHLVTRGHRLSVNLVKAMEFIEYGYCTDESVFDGIYRIGGPRVLSCYADGRFDIEVIERHLLGTSAPVSPTEAPDAVVERLKTAVDRLGVAAVSADLTGGQDSRLCAAALHQHHCLSEAAGSSADGAAPDLVLARRCADILGVPFYGLVHQVPDENVDLDALLEYGGGLADLLPLHRHRSIQLSRVERCVQHAVSGIGGELLKDFWWLQDFPYYNRRRADIKRLLSTRVNPIPQPLSILTKEAIQALEVARGELTSRVNSLADTATSNTEAYDRIYFHEKMANVPSPYIVGCEKEGISLMPLLLDRGILDAGFSARRSDRFMAGLHRHALANLLPPLCSISTTEGTRLQPGVAKWLDSGAWAANKSKRFAKKVVQKATGVTVFQSSPNARGHVLSENADA